MARGANPDHRTSARAGARSNGLVLYRGPSRLDGRSIVAVLTGLRRRSRNAKTGPMLQTWILRERVDPVRAAHTGADASVCGACPLRSSPSISRRCYVNLGQAPLAIYAALRRGAYPRASDAARIQAAAAGHAVRLGSYGDPAAVPTWIWTALVSRASSWTGYTHQWARSDFDARLLDLCMASVETDADIADLRARHPGARYFRIRRPGSGLARGEMQCPASAEAGHRLGCAECGACAGRSKRGRSISITAHGAVALRFWLPRA
jgi:hypothetical protein